MVGSDLRGNVLGWLNSTMGGSGGMAANQRFVEAFVKSLGVIGASEIGDKTFFIAAIMAMRHPRLTVRRSCAHTRMLDHAHGQYSQEATCAPGLQQYVRRANGQLQG
jgi:hypothetical protein